MSLLPDSLGLFQDSLELLYDVGVFCQDWTQDLEACFISLLETLFKLNLPPYDFFEKELHSPPYTAKESETMPRNAQHP